MFLFTLRCVIIFFFFFFPLSRLFTTCSRLNLTQLLDYLNLLPPGSITCYHAPPPTRWDLTLSHLLAVISCLLV